MPHPHQIKIPTRQGRMQCNRKRQNSWAGAPRGDKFKNDNAMIMNPTKSNKVQPVQQTNNQLVDTDNRYPIPDTINLDRIVRTCIIEIPPPIKVVQKSKGEARESNPASKFTLQFNTGYPSQFKMHNTCTLV